MIGGAAHLVVITIAMLILPSVGEVLAKRAPQYQNASGPS
jgi:hypothetical protein